MIGQPTTMEGLIRSITPEAQLLSKAFWPGLLTLVGYSQPSLSWEVTPLADPTVSLRMPLHPVPWKLAVAVGPLALTGANIAGADLPTTCEQAANQFGNEVAVYLDAGPSPRTVGSTVVDVTTSPPRMLREGAVPIDELRRVVPELAD